MAFPVAAGGNAWADAITTIFASKFNVEFYDDSIIPLCANTDWEGELKKQGDTVRITTMPSITINDHYDGQDLEYQNLDPGKVEMVVERAKSWSFRLPDVSMKQQGIVGFAEEVGAHAGREMSMEICTDFLADIYGDAHASNQGATAGAKSGAFNLGVSGTPATFNYSTATHLITAINAVLDEQSAPKQGRFVVLPAIFIQQLILSDLKAVYITGDSESPLRNGKVGNIGPLQLIESNLLTTTTDTVEVFNCPFGCKSAISFASQLVEEETLRSERTFGDLMRGLHVHDWKVTKPEGVGWLYAKYAAPS